jgi:hypothetical protein
MSEMWGIMVVKMSTLIYWSIKMEHKKMQSECELDWTGSEQWAVTDSCEYGNEPLGSMKPGNFLMPADNQIL